MQQKYEDPKHEGKNTSHLLSALEAAVEIQKRKVLVGPNDAVGILLFNTVSVIAPSSRAVAQSLHRRHIKDEKE